MGIEFSRLGPVAQKQILQKLQQKHRERAKPSKYRNVKTQRQTEQEPITFDSQKEARRYDELILELKAGLIRDLRLQSQVHQGWALVVEDVKSKANKTAQYQMKWKIMQERFGIAVEEI